MGGVESGWRWGDGLSIGLRNTLSIVIGASEGIGAAIAVALTRAGSTLIAAGRDSGRMAATLEGARETGGTAYFETVDVRQPESIAAFSHNVLEKHGTPTVLINSMGGTLVREMLDVAVEEWDDLHHTHLRGTFLTCQAFGGAMGKKGYGKIVNLSSLAATHSNKRRGVYSVAKAGLNRLTEVLAAEWAPFGVRVNGIAPVTTTTPRAVKQFAREPEREAEVIKRIPLGRLATPEDMVGPALFLASPLSDFITGQTLVVDGGSMTVR